MSIFNIFRRKKWEGLGVSVPSEKLYDELWSRQPTGIYLRDREYRAIPFKDFIRLVDAWRLLDPKYAAQIFDCDDYVCTFEADLRRAWASVSNGFEALAFGGVNGLNSEGTGHAWIWHRDEAGVYRWVEAQQNRLMIGTPRNFSMFWG